MTLAINPYKRALFALVMAAIIITILGQYTNIDLNIEDYYYNAPLKVFTWKNTWFAKNLMHVYVKDSILGLGISLILVTLADIILPWQKINPLQRIRLRFVAVAAILIPTVISSLKRFSVLHCPWDIQRYGGDAPFLRLFAPMPQGMQAGQCFPAGHASTALWLAAFCVFWLPHKPKTALRVFLIGIGMGFGLGWVQQMRGAHFLFHTLWATWLASLMVLIMLMLAHQPLQQSTLSKNTSCL